LTGHSRPPHPSIIYGFSPRVVPVASDAQTRRVATGYWMTEEPGEPVEPKLREFVERPGAVVSIGFGSMRTKDPAALRGLVEEAVAHAGVRAVLLSGWGALTADASISDRVFVAESVSHGWLFSRVAATVHHGGAGTTGAAMRAGVPTVVVPFGADQPFWASRAAALGVAPPPIPRRKLTAALLAEAIESCVTSRQMQDGARALGEDLRAEDGNGAAVRELERIAAER
jgi:UDP:flavonoid glycosyltransferase YjiC (YdhE family)